MYDSLCNLLMASYFVTSISRAIQLVVIFRCHYLKDPACIIGVSCSEVLSSGRTTMDNKILLS